MAHPPTAVCECAVGTFSSSLATLCNMQTKTNFLETNFESLLSIVDAGLGGVRVGEDCVVRLRHNGCIAFTCAITILCFLFRGNCFRKL